MEKELFGFKIEEIGKDHYKISCLHSPQDMVVKIKKQGSGYRAICNYSIWYKGAAGPYQAMHLHPTKDQTLNELLISLKPAENEPLDKYCWVKEKSDYVMLGNGQILSYNDFMK